MVKVTLGNNLNRTKVIVSPTKTIREILEENNIQYTVSTMHLDGCALDPEDFERPLVDLIGDAEQCYLLQVAKADNA